MNMETNGIQFIQRNFGHIITLACLVTSAVSVYVALNTRLTAVEVKMDEIHRQQIEFQKATSQNFRHMDAKMDRVIEREVARREY